jgi:DNA replication protein DnaC
LKQAATPEDVNFRHPRRLDRGLFARLMTGRWVSDHQNVLICGPTGIGKTYLACALANQACRQGHSVLYVRLTRLLPALAIGRGDGSYLKSLAQLAKTEVLVIDEWGLAPLSDESRRDLLEIFDDRHGTRSTIITSQLQVEHWHASIGDPTLADAILDRLVHQAHTLDLDGESLRKPETPV